MAFRQPSRASSVLKSLSVSSNVSCAPVRARRAASSARFTSVTKSFTSGSTVSGADSASCCATVFAVRSRYAAFTSLLQCDFTLRFSLSKAGIGAISSLLHPALVKQPGDDGPLHRLFHERLGFFDFGKLPHGSRVQAAA